MNKHMSKMVLPAKTFTGVLLVLMHCCEVWAYDATKCEQAQDEKYQTEYALSDAEYDLYECEWYDTESCADEQDDVDTVQGQYDAAVSMEWRYCY